MHHGLHFDGMPNRSSIGTAGLVPQVAGPIAANSDEVGRFIYHGKCQPLMEASW
jgi:hypothetical protein